MAPIRPNQLGMLEWRQPAAFRNHFELKSGDSVLAEIDFLKPFGTLAQARTAQNSWTFKRNGFLSPIITARLEGSETDILTYEPNWTMGKGRLTVPGGEVLEFKSTSFWGGEWLLHDAKSQPLLKFRNQGVFHHGAMVEVLSAGKHRSDLGLLLTICWYLLVLYMWDSAAGAAAT